MTKTIILAQGNGGKENNKRPLSKLIKDISIELELI